MKLAKTVLTFVVALALVATMALSAFAAGAATITSDKANVAVGDTFTITVAVSNFNAEQIAAFQHDVKYDATLVKMVGDITKVSARDGGLEGTIEGAKSEEGYIIFGGMSANAFELDSYACFTATFEAIAEGEAKFDFVGGEKFEFFDVDEAKKDFAATGCVVTIGEKATDAPTAAPTAAPEKSTGKVDKTPATGTNASMAIVAGLVVLAGAAFVASKKSK